MPIVIRTRAPKAPSVVPPVPVRLWQLGVPHVFECMLAASPIPKPEELVFPLMASYKFDGIRAPLTSGVAMSRKMLELPNKHIQQWAWDNAHHLQGFDGELIVGPPNLETTYNTTTSGVMSAGGEPDFGYYLFESWDMPSVPAKERYEYLIDRHAALPVQLRSRVHLVEQILVRDIAELRTLYALAIRLGYEGLILKDPRKPYKFGRSSILEAYAMKWKEFIDIDCVVLSAVQGKKNNNEKVKDELGKAKRSTAKGGKILIEAVGGFIVKCVDRNSPFFGKTFNAGPGPLKKDELARLWKEERDSIPGRYMKVKIAKAGAMDLPRFPMFNGWRDPIDL